MKEQGQNETQNGGHVQPVSTWTPPEDRQKFVQEIGDEVERRNHNVFRTEMARLEERQRQASTMRKVSFGLGAGVLLALGYGLRALVVPKPKQLEAGNEAAIEN